jgi:glyoxylase I family protein
MSLGSVNNIDYVILLCTDMAAMRRFYGEVMGFPLEQDFPTWMSFRVGSGLLTIRPRGPWITWDDGPIPKGSAGVQLAFRVAPRAVDACYQVLQEKQVKILCPPKDVSGFGHRAVFFQDPEGNVIEFYAEV